jgi:integrase
MTGPRRGRRRRAHRTRCLAPRGLRHHLVLRRERVTQTVLALVPRDDRTTDRKVFQGFAGDRFRTAITRACVATGTPAFSPHDLRHRRISLLHLGGVPWARIGEHVGQRNLAVTANTYAHVLGDETEVDYAEALTL